MPIFSAGTKTIFQQTNAPTGWTKDTTNYNNHCLRVVSGSAASGGSVDFTNTFTTTPFSNAPFPMPGTFGATTLATPNIPPHQHAVGGPGGPAPTLPALSETTRPGTSQIAPSPTSPAGRSLPTTANPTAFASGAASPAQGAGSHTHPFSMTVTGSCGDLSVRYVDVIICSKD